LRKATAKKEQKIKPENYAPRKRGVIALAVSGEIFVKRVFSRERFSAYRIKGGNFTIKVNRLARGYLDSEKAKEGILPSGTSKRSAVV